MKVSQYLNQENIKYSPKFNQNEIVNRITQSILPISIIIPTYQREQVLIDTLTYLLELPTKAAEIIVVDQTQQHQPETISQLKELEIQEKICWIKLSHPSIPYAMNEGILTAKYEIVLFLDDDIIPEADLVLSHWQAHQEYENIIVAGRVIQPWEENQNLAVIKSPFATTEDGWRPNFMGGNFSVHTQQIIALGGLDENFVKVAYQFEAEFAYRFLKSGARIRFEPLACIHHLKVSAGGTRSHGHHLTTCEPNHTVGDYYYLLCAKEMHGRLYKILTRPIRSITNRHHLFKPWWIPFTLIAEFRGLLWALTLFTKGPSYIDQHIKFTPLNIDSA